MLKIKVEYTGALTSISGKNEEELLLIRGATILTVVKELANKYGEKAADFLFDKEGNLQVLTFINGSLGSLDKSIDTGDIVTFLPPFVGG